MNSALTGERTDNRSSAARLVDGESPPWALLGLGVSSVGLMMRNCSGRVGPSDTKSEF